MLSTSKVEYSRHLGFWSIFPVSVSENKLLSICLNPTLFLLDFIFLFFNVTVAENFRLAAFFLKINFR